MRKPRLRDLGIVIGTMPPGPLNAITDVSGVRVGHSTIIDTERGINTGVSAIQPHAGSAFHEMPPAAISVLNGAGEMTGRSQIDEYGYLESPILITNTLSVGAVHQATCEWLGESDPQIGADFFLIPVVAETYDGFMSDTAGQHVKREHVFEALDNALGGPVPEGNVGGGTGMLTGHFKGGIGTSSRTVAVAAETFTVGVLVQSNFGTRADLTIDCVPVGREITDLELEREPMGTRKDGSIIVVVATDAPLSDRQLNRLARRAELGVGRAGGIGRHSSGDIVIAFSNHPRNLTPRMSGRQELPADQAFFDRVQLNDIAIDPFFQATIEATTEAVANALIAAETMVGRHGRIAHAVPHDRLVEVWKRYGRGVSS